MSFVLESRPPELEEILTVEKKGNQINTFFNDDGSLMPHALFVMLLFVNELINSIKLFQLLSYKLETNLSTLRS